MTLLLCSMFPIGLLQGSGWSCGMMRVNIVMMMMMMMMKIIFLNGTMVIKNERLKKPQEKKNSCLLLGIHHGGGIGVSPRMKKGIQKHCGYKHGLFCVW